MAKSRRTHKQKSASRRNLKIARAAKKRGTKSGFKSEYKKQRSHGMPKNIARNVSWGKVKKIT